MVPNIQTPLLNTNSVRSKYRLACWAIALIVLLRVGIGWHFFYEGVHKFDPHAGFTSEGFLGIAKGPAADLYYWMLPDLEGLQRIELARPKDEHKREFDTFAVYEDAWKEYFRGYLAWYAPTVSKTDMEAVVNFYIVEGATVFVREYRGEHPDAAEADAQNKWKEYLKEYLLKCVPNMNSTDAGNVVNLVQDTKNTWKEYCKKCLEKYAPNAGKEDQEAVVNFYVSDDAAKFKDKLKKYWTDTAGVDKSDADAIAGFCDSEDTGKKFKEYLSKDISSMSAAETDSILNLYAPRFAEWFAKNAVTEVDAVEIKMLFKSKMIFNQYLVSLRAGASDTKKDIEAFLESRNRFLETKSTIRNSTSFEQERRWNAMMKYRREAAGWTKMLTEMGNGLQSDLGRLADPELAGLLGLIVTAPERELIPPNDYIQYQIPEDIQIPLWNKRIQSRMQAMDLAVMLGLSAIGLCLMIGFCTRLACLGGAAFLVNVILTTFPVPGVYPEIPSMVGNFMVVSKDVVELLALLVLALIPSGRWGGFDYFLWNYGGKQIAGLFCPCGRSDEK